MVVAGRAFGLDSHLSSNKVSLLTMEQTPQPRTGINNVEYKGKQKRSYPCTLLRITLIIGYKLGVLFFYRAVRSSVSSS